MKAPSPALAREARLVAETGHLEGRRPHVQHSIATRAQEHMLHSQSGMTSLLGGSGMPSWS